MLSDVCDEYGILLRHLVDQSVGMLARYCEKLIVLATTPFTLCERQDVLRSSLILMINKLCSSTNQDTGLLDLSQRNHAWRSFQVLIDRLVNWENDKGNGCVGEWMDGCVGGWMCWWVDGWMDVWVDGCVGGWMCGWVDGCVGGWMDGCVGG